MGELTLPNRDNNTIVSNKHNCIGVRKIMETFSITTAAQQKYPVRSCYIILAPS